MSKFMYFDFKCTLCDHVSEQFVKPDVHNMPCSECAGTTARLISGGRPKLDINSDRWAKMNKQKTKQDKKFYADHGVDKLHHSCGS